MKRTVLAFTALAVLLAGCGNPLGRDVPACDANISNTMVLQVQSVPSASYVACVNRLKPGWTYDHAQIQSGRSVFWLDSDRMGDPFVTVEVLPTCDFDGESFLSGRPDVRLFKDVRSEFTVDIVLIPEGRTPATEARATEIANILDDAVIKGRTVMVSVSDSSGPVADRIDRAAALGAHVIDISIRDAEEGTLTLVLKGNDEELEVDDLNDAIEEIEDVETEPTYTGNWYYVFEGGCVVYTFDAVGHDVSTIENDITASLGIFNAETLRDFARDLGYNI